MNSEPNRYKIVSLQLNVPFSPSNKHTPSWSQARARSNGVAAYSVQHGGHMKVFNGILCARSRPTTYTKKIGGPARVLFSKNVSAKTKAENTRISCIKKKMWSAHAIFLGHLVRLAAAHKMYQVNFEAQPICFKQKCSFSLKKKKLSTRKIVCSFCAHGAGAPSALNILLVELRSWIPVCSWVSDTKDTQVCLEGVYVSGVMWWEL